MEAYEPERLRIMMVCNPRGGISSKLTIDSVGLRVVDKKNLMIGMDWEVKKVGAF